MAPSAFSLLVLCFLLISSSSAIAGERRVGVRTAMENVESNREVQDLGRFCVEQYNTGMRRGGAPILSFSRVIAAETQVVSGIKYYLRIVAGDPAAGRRRVYEAAVVVRPWAEARELVSFAPSSSGGRKKNH